MNPFTRSLEKKGRFGDTLIAHLSQTEANVLKKAGGAGTVNPFTGALEFYKGTMNNTQAIANTPPEEEAEGAALDTSKPSVGAVFADAVANFDNMPDNSSSSSESDPNAGYEGKAHVAKNVALIKNNIRYVFDDNLADWKYVYFSDDGHEPNSPQANQEMNERLRKIGYDVWATVAGAKNNNDANEDMVARDASIFLRAIGSGGRQGNFKRGGPLVSEKDMFKAYLDLGITGYNPDDERSTGFYNDEGGITFDTSNGKAITLAQQEITNRTSRAWDTYQSQFDSRNKSSADGPSAPGNYNAHGVSVNTDGTGGAAALSDGGPHGIGISIGSDTTSPSHISNYAKTMAREAAFAFGITGVSPTNTVRTISKLANDGGVVGPSNVVVGPDGRVADNTDESLLGDLKVGWRAFSESLMNNIAGTTNQQSTTAADTLVTLMPIVLDAPPV